MTDTNRARAQASSGACAGTHGASSSRDLLASVHVSDPTDLEHRLPARRPAPLSLALADVPTRRRRALRRHRPPAAVCGTPLLVQVALLLYPSAHLAAGVLEALHFERLRVGLRPLQLHLARGERHATARRRQVRPQPGARAASGGRETHAPQQCPIATCAGRQACSARTPRQARTHAPHSRTRTTDIPAPFAAVGPGCGARSPWRGPSAAGPGAAWPRARCTRGTAASASLPPPPATTCSGVPAT